MKFAHEAFEELFPDIEIPNIEIKYSGRFSAYNANVKYKHGVLNNELNFALSKNWRKVDDSIKKGLIQSLMLKIYRRKYNNLPKKTVYTDLYNNFTKNLHMSIEKTKAEPLLVDSFQRVNQIYHKDSVEQPNLEWGEYSKRTLGIYNYQTDTIKISKYFENAPNEFIDIIMHHEILHKRLKFKCNSSKTYHHSTEFKKLEKEFNEYEKTNKEMQNYIRYKRMPIVRAQNVSVMENLDKWPNHTNNQINKNHKQFNLKKWLFG